MIVNSILGSVFNLLSYSLILKLIKFDKLVSLLFLNVSKILNLTSASLIRFLILNNESISSGLTSSLMTSYIGSSLSLDLPILKKP